MCATHIRWLFVRTILRVQSLVVVGAIHYELGPLVIEIGRQFPHQVQVVAEALGWAISFLGLIFRQRVLVEIQSTVVGRAGDQLRTGELAGFALVIEDVLGWLGLIRCNHTLLC